MRRWAAVALVVVVVAGCAPAGAASPRLGALEHRPVLDTLGIPRLERLRLEPLWSTGFERDEDLAGFYVTPQSPLTRHEVGPGNSHSGTRSHLAWLTGAVGSEPVDGPNHRGYPTIQLQRRSGGACVTPCVVELWVRINDWQLRRGEWLSLATFTSDPSDRWAKVVTVNLDPGGWLNVFHVPDHGKAVRSYERKDVRFPSNRWVRVTTWLDLDPAKGSVAVWQDGVLVTAARVTGGDRTLDQLHFGLYAHPATTSGSVRNDDIAVYRARSLR